MEAATAPSRTVQHVVVGSGMDAQLVISNLDDHGLQDITQRIDFSTITSYAIHRGGFGQVYQARMYDGIKVAVKALVKVVEDVGEIDPKAEKRAGREGYSWSKFQHLNILPLLGVALHNNQVVLVSPWIDNGALPKYILHHPEADRCILACQVAEGVAYMHSIGATHGDIKGPNILVSCNGTAMLTDFGSTILQHYTLHFTPTSTAGWSARWAAPEILAGEVPCSMEGDVWALGMTILEIITGEPPYSKIKNDLAVISCIAVLKQLPSRPNERIPPNSSFGEQLWALLTSCWAFEPSRRPTAARVRDRLKAIVDLNEERME
ncbi:hypothetical protein FRC09_014014 [Ceratobasidium sp. 395]|nr:hypothetical protein FRC09_014014 [Ceratobasidium sp. 395]